MRVATSGFGTNRTTSDVRCLVAIGGKRKWRGQPISVAIDPTETSGPFNFGGRLGAISQTPLVAKW
jgi:hypothetical protein